MEINAKYAERVEGITQWATRMVSERGYGTGTVLQWFLNRCAEKPSALTKQEIIFCSHFILNMKRRRK